MSQLTDGQRQRFADALARLDGDEGTLIMLAEMVVEDAPTLLGQLSSDVRAAKVSDAAATGHSLKGLLSTFETGPPVSELQPLIDAARSGDDEEAASLLGEIRPSLEKLVEEIRGIAAAV